MPSVRVLCSADIAAAFIGAVGQAPLRLEGMLLARGFDRVRLYSRTRASAERLAQAAPSTDARIEVVDSAQAALHDDVVVTVTNSRKPVLWRDWLAHGAHATAVGASTLASQELDIATVAACSLSADRRDSVVNEAREFRAAVEAGAIVGPEHIRAEIGEVIAGLHSGRTSNDELTVFRSLGLAVEDLAAAERAVANARRDGRGVEVAL